MSSSTALGASPAGARFAIVLVMAFNVLLRYFFRTGSVAMQELEWHLMAPICMLGLSYAILKDGHVQVDILYGRFPERVQRHHPVHLDACWSCWSSAILLKLSIPYVLQSYNIGEKSPDPGGLTHRWILKSMLPIGFALLLSRALRRCCVRSSPFLTPSAQVKSATHTV